MTYGNYGKILLAGAALSLAACGGGGGGGGVGSTPAPPAAPPVPAEAPPHTFSYNYAKPVFGAELNLIINSVNGASSGETMNSLAEYGDVYVQENRGEYAIWADQSSWADDIPIFTDATRGANPTSGDEINNFDYFRYDYDEGGVHSAQLHLLKKSATNTRIELTYLTYGVYSDVSGPPTARHFHTAAFALGERTPSSGMPTSGTGSYSGIVDGYASIGDVGYRLLGSTGTLTANFASGTLATTLSMQGNRDLLTGTLGSVQAFGTLSGTGTIWTGESSYVGSLAGFGMTGDFSGGFFGPAANETGFGFYAVSGNGGDIMSGVFVGKK